jgi:hypothetical protein
MQTKSMDFGGADFMRYGLPESVSGAFLAD